MSGNTGYSNYDYRDDRSHIIIIDFLDILKQANTKFMKEKDPIERQSAIINSMIDRRDSVIGDYRWNEKEKDKEKEKEKQIALKQMDVIYSAIISDFIINDFKVNCNLDFEGLEAKEIRNQIVKNFELASKHERYSEDGLSKILKAKGDFKKWLINTEESGYNCDDTTQFGKALKGFVNPNVNFLAEKFITTLQSLRIDSAKRNLNRGGGMKL